jgi:hypothetical protein
MRFISSIALAIVFVALSGTAFAQTAQEKISLHELLATAADTPRALPKSNAEVGIYVSTTKKRVSPETEKQYLKTHPEGAFILPADTQERIKAGLPVQVIKINLNDLTTTNAAKK